MKKQFVINVRTKCILGVCALIGFGGGFYLTPYNVQVALISTNPAAETKVDLSHREALLRSVALTFREHNSEDKRRDSGDIFPSSLVSKFWEYGAEVRLDQATAIYYVLCRGLKKEELVTQANKMAVRFCERIRIVQVDSNQSFQEHDLSELNLMNRSFQESTAELQALQAKLGVQNFPDELKALTAKQKDLQLQIENARLELDSRHLQITNDLQEIVLHHPTVLSLRRSLNEALLHYTEAHPKVQELRGSLSRLESRIRDQKMQVDADILSQGNSLAQHLYAQVVKLRSESVVLRGKLERLATMKESVDQKVSRLIDHQVLFHELQTKVDSLKVDRAKVKQDLERRALAMVNPDDLVRVLDRAEIGDVQSAQKWINGFLSALSLVLIGTGMVWVGGGKKTTYRRINTIDALAEVSGLPILGSLDHTVGMTASQFENWAFDTFTTLKGKLNSSSSSALVCGFISSQNGEGRSTWVKALGNAARKKGLRVLTINAGSMTDQCRMIASKDKSNVADPGASKSMSIVSRIDETLATGMEGASLDVQSLQWIWDLDNRLQWKSAMEKCLAMDNAVVLIELPPIRNRESVMLAEHIPNVIWLCGRGQTTERQTQSEIDILRCAQVHLSGAVMNCPKS